MKAAQRTTVRSRRWAGLVVFALSAWSMPAAFAAGYPDRPITFVVPYDPGGASDLWTRLIASHLEKRLGQPVIVENKPGANGVFGTAYAAKMPPDGYTVAVGTNSTFVVNTFLYKKLPYDPVRDFRPLTQLHINYLAIIVAADVQAKTLADFIALAKSKPGELNAAAGTANVTLADSLFELKAGIDMEVVNYKSVVAALQDMAAGRVQVAVTDVSSSLPYLDSKQVRALAIAGPHRSPALPDVPDTEEAGLPGFIVSAWTGFFMPKGTPDAIVDRMSTELRAVLHDPEIEQVVHTGGGQIVASSPAEFGAFLQTDLTNMAAAAKAAKVEPQ